MRVALDPVYVSSRTHMTSRGSVSCDLLKKQGRAIKNKIIRGKEGVVSEGHGWLSSDKQFLVLYIFLSNSQSKK